MKKKAKVKDQPAVFRLVAAVRDNDLELFRVGSIPPDVTYHVIGSNSYAARLVHAINSVPFNDGLPWT